MAAVVDRVYFKYADFQHSTVVLVGPWRFLPSFLSNLRYSIHFDPATRNRWVQDAQDPSKREWKIDGAPGDPPPQVDYAIVTRVYNEETKQWILALNGLYGYGTQAAGEFVTNPEIARKIPSLSERKAISKSSSAPH